MKILNLEYEKYKLSNGLEVILHENKNHPLVSVNIWYRVGSSNERKGKTGIAHLFEHMMFQGSQNVPKEMHFRHIQEAGGNLNGSTSFDRTNYYEKVPSNFIELILWLESDRMGYLLPALTQEKLQNQIDVVRNERLERYDNQPYGLAWEIQISHLYPEGHPYSWPTIGYIDDINSYTLEDVIDFFKVYYSPSNATLAVAGNFDRQQTKDLIEKYFGGIPSVPIIPEITPPRHNFKNNVILKRKENVQLDRIYFTWHSGKAFGNYDASLDLLGDILTGSKNARLYKSLVYQREEAQDISAYQYSGKYAGHFMLAATAKPGHSVDDLKRDIFSEIDNIRKNGVTEKELQRSKYGVKSSFIYSMQNVDSLADQLNYYNFYTGEPNYFANDLKRYEEVSIESVKECADMFLSGNYVELHISPDNEQEE